MPSLLLALFTSELTSGSPYTCPALPRLPTQVPPKDPPYKTSPETSSTQDLILYETTNGTPNSSPPGTFIVPKKAPYETPNGSPYTGLTP